MADDLIGLNELATGLGFRGGAGAIGLIGERFVLDFLISAIPGKRS